MSVNPQYPRNRCFRSRDYAVLMAIYYIGRTALDFWRWHASTLSVIETPKPVRNIQLSDKRTDPEEAQIGCACFHKSSNPVQLMVKRKNLARSLDDICYTVCGLKLPPNAFCKLNHKRFVASPEFTFATLAKHLDLLELVLVGCELTGMYAMDDTDERGFSKCEPLASAETISRMVSNCKGFDGVKRASMAIQHVVENAASPMETCVALLLTLPRRLGGYGLPKPCLNYALDLTLEQRIALKRESITVDMMWPAAKMAIEYESTAWHRGDEKFVQDSIRRNDIRALGYDVTTITLDEYKNSLRMDNIVKAIARKLRIHPHLSQIDGCKQASLRRSLRRPSI